MSLGIPLPGSFGKAFGEGLDTGSTLISRIMQPILQREGDQRQWAQHQQSIAQQEAQLQQAWQQHLQELAIRQAQEQRLAEREPYERQELQARTGYHNAQSKGLAFDQTLLQQLLDAQGMGQTGGYQGGNNMPPPMSSPQGGPQSQFNPPPGMEGQRAPQQGGMGNIADNPILAGLIKKRLGIDVYDESPDKKDQRALENFIKKKQYEQDQKKNEDLTELTPASRTKYQENVREINSVLPVMRELVEKGGEKFTGFSSANDLSYLRKVKRIADVYMKAKGWPNTDKARNDAIELFKRGFNESPEQYKAQMEELEKELLGERDLSIKALSSGKVSMENPTADKIKIRNKKTGEEREVTQEEYDRLSKGAQ